MDYLLEISRSQAEQSTPSLWVRIRSIHEQRGSLASGGPLSRTCRGAQLMLTALRSRARNDERSLIEEQSVGRGGSIKAAQFRFDEVHRELLR